MILVLEYQVLRNICRYWVVIGTTRWYFYWLSYPIPILLSHLDASGTVVASRQWQGN